MFSLFRSIRFNVVLFLLIAFLAALGTLIPQTADNADKVASFMASDPGWGRVFDAWGFFDIYHTFLFAALLALMAFDVIVCKLWNKPPDPGLIPLAGEQEEDGTSIRALKKKPHRLEGVLAASPADITTPMMTDLRKANYFIKKLTLPGGGRALIASRHRLQRWGSYISHISLVVILMGATLRSLFGFETFLPVLEGQSANVTEQLRSDLQDPPAQNWSDRVFSEPRRLHNTLQHHSLDPISRWEIFVDNFTVDFYPNSTTPSTFASKLRLYDAGRLITDTTIRVNQPLDVDHVRFYQASWGVTGMIREAILQVGGRTLSLGMKDTFPVPGQPWTARIEHYLPDFTIGADGQPTTASLEWKNPALVIGFYNKNQARIGTLALSAPSPTTPADAQPWGFFFFAGGHLKIHPPFQVLAVRPVLFSGVQVSYDPGFPLIVGGVLAMLFGLCTLFYMHQRRVLVFLRPQEDGRTRVDIGGWSSRGEKEFELEFKRLFDRWALHPATPEDV